MEQFCKNLLEVIRIEYEYINSIQIIKGLFSLTYLTISVEDTKNQFEIILQGSQQTLTFYKMQQQEALAEFNAQRLLSVLNTTLQSNKLCFPKILHIGNSKYICKSKGVSLKEALTFSSAQSASQLDITPWFHSQVNQYLHVFLIM